MVETDLLAEDFIEALRNESLLLTLGARTMTGLVGNIDVPRRSGVSTGYWLANETTAITQSESTFDQVSLAPKTLVYFLNSLDRLFYRQLLELKN